MARQRRRPILACAVVLADGAAHGFGAGRDECHLQFSLRESS